MRATQKQIASKQSAVALKAFFAIAKKWELTPEQERIILSIPRATYYLWKKQLDGALTQDTLERISYILGIYKALHILLPNPEAANAWIHKPNYAPLFGGHTAIEKLTKGRVVDLADVRRYLDAERG